MMIQMLQKRLRKLFKVKDFLTTTDVEDMPLQDILLQLELSQQTYNTALQTSHRGPNVILERNPQDVFLNACNQDILYLWGGNIDLQLVINENATVMMSATICLKVKRQWVKP